MARSTTLLPLLLLACAWTGLHAATWTSTRDFEVQAKDDLSSPQAKARARFTHQAKYYYSTQMEFGRAPTQAAVGYVACKRGTVDNLNFQGECRSCPETQYSASGFTEQAENCFDSPRSGSLLSKFPFVSVGVDRSGISYPAVFNYFQQFVSLPYQATVQSPWPYNANPDDESVADFMSDPHSYVPESPSANPTYVISHDSVDIHLEATGVWGEMQRRAYLDVGACAPAAPGYGASYVRGESNMANFAQCLGGKETAVISPALISLQYQVTFNGKKGQIITQAPVSHTDLSIFLKDLKEGYYELDVWAVLRKGTGLFSDLVSGTNFTMPDDVKTPYPTEFSWFVKRSKNSAVMTANDQCNVLPGPPIDVTTQRSSPFYFNNENLLDVAVQKARAAKPSFCHVVALNNANRTILASPEFEYPATMRAHVDTCDNQYWSALAGGRGQPVDYKLDLTGNLPGSGVDTWYDLWTRVSTGAVNLKLRDVLATDSRQQFALPPGCQSSDVVRQLKAFYQATWAVGGLRSPGSFPPGPQNALAYDNVFGEGALGPDADVSDYNFRILFEDASLPTKKIRFPCVGGKYTQTRSRDENQNVVQGIYPLTNIFGRVQLVGPAAMPIVYQTYYGDASGYAPQAEALYIPTASDTLTYDAWMDMFGASAGMGMIEVTPCWECEKVTTTIAHFSTVAPTELVGPSQDLPPQYGTTGFFWAAPAGKRSTVDSVTYNPDPIVTAITQIDEAASEPLRIIVDGKFVAPDTGKGPLSAAIFDSPAVVFGDVAAAHGTEHIGSSNYYTATFTCMDAYGSVILADSFSACMFYCSVDNKAYFDANNQNATHGEFACTSPLVVKPVSTGASTLAVRAVDSCGVSGPVNFLRIAADHTAPMVRFKGIPARQTELYLGQDDLLRNKYKDFCFDNPFEETCKIQGESAAPGALPKPDLMLTDKQFKYYDICKVAGGSPGTIGLVVINYREEEGLDAGTFNTSLSSVGFTPNAIENSALTGGVDNALYLAGMDATAAFSVKTPAGVWEDVGSRLSAYLDVNPYQLDPAAPATPSVRDNSLDISVSSGTFEYDTVIAGNISITVDPNTPDRLKDCSAVLGLRLVNGKYHFGVLSYTNCKTVNLKFQLVNPEYAAFCAEGQALGMACGQGEGYYTTNLMLPIARDDINAWAANGFTTATIKLSDLPDASLIVPCDERFPVPL